MPRFFFEGGGALKPKAEAPVAAGPVRAAFDFEAATDLAPWHALDDKADIAIPPEEGVAHAGRGCLRLSYLARETAFEQLSASPLVVGGGVTLSFWIKTDLPTNLSFGVVERGGAFYQQFAAIPANEWTRVSVPLASLILSQDTDDPSGRLEPERIEEIRLADLANLPGALGDALGRKAGVHSLYLDDVAISDFDEPAPAAGHEGENAPLVDDFERGAIHALAIGDALLRRGAAEGGQALEVVCEQRLQRWMGFVVAVGQLDLAAAQKLTFRAKASQPLILSVCLEEWDNSKYGQRVALDPAAGWVEKTIPLDALILETESDDENGRLDRRQIRVLVLTGDMARVEQFPVTFSVDDVRFE
jgi:hypothetical protein